MQHESISPAVQKACDYIKGNLNSGEWRPGEYLPSARRLAKSSGVSFSSIIKAVARLKAEGLISTAQRVRIRAGSEFTTNQPLEEQKKPVWLIKRAAIEKDILDGAYAQQGKLPSNKELQARYGACFNTMRKILRSMVADGVLQLRGKSHYLRNEQSAGVAPRVVFITSIIKSTSALNQGQYKVIDELERECLRRNIVLDVVQIDFYDNTATRRALTEPAVNGRALGYIVDILWNEAFRHSIFDVLLHCAKQKSPVAILDGIGNFDLPIHFSATPLFQVFRIEDKIAGGRVARMLLGMGHKSVVYISYFHNQIWSLRRFLGVKEQYSRAGCSTGVHLSATDTFGSPLELVMALSGWDDKLVRRILGADRTESQAQDAYANYKQFKKPKSLEAYSPEAVRRVVRELAKVPALVKMDLDITFLNKIIPMAITRAGDQLAEIILRPLLELALKFHDATAWICATDTNAIMALTFLKERGIRVPQDISIVGFDNTPITALENRLTSYDFNAAGFIHRMLDYISRTPRPRGRYRHAPIEVEGIVMQRETTSRPSIST